jgi:hypothetical protein
VGADAHADKKKAASMAGSKKTIRFTIYPPWGLDVSSKSTAAKHEKFMLTTVDLNFFKSKRRKIAT